MVIHIVRMHERTEEILENYHITIDDLKKENRHITDFSNIVPGTKLRITPLSEENIQILEKSEPLILNNDNDPSVYGIEDDIKEEVKEEKVNTYRPGIRYVNPPRMNRYRRY